MLLILTTSQSKMTEILGSGLRGCSAEGSDWGFTSVFRFGGLKDMGCAFSFSELSSHSRSR